MVVASAVATVVLKKRRKRFEKAHDYWSKIERDFSAKTLFTVRTRFFVLLILASIFLSYSTQTSAAVWVTVMCINLLYFFTNTYRLNLFFTGLKILEHNKDFDHLLTLTDAKLPKYTILIPLFREAAVIPSLTNAMKRMDYPKDKFQVLLILEEEDDETPVAIDKLKLPKYFQKVVVPKSHPQTKAKACNYALSFATGDLIGIFDAEDRPDIDQLRKVAEKFSKFGNDIGCIQARLSYYNASENWLTGMFALEYANLFNYILPAMARSDFPIPLGGSSNHFRAEILREMHGWDPYNVTEDADLGLRLSAKGYKIRMVYSYTPEEATISFKAWVKQRSRWIKGYIHTYLVYMRHPIYVYQKYHFKGFIFFNYILFISPFLLSIFPIMIYLSINIILGHYVFGEVPELVLKFFTWFNMAYGMLAQLFMTYIMCHVQTLDAVKRTWWTYPFYFLLHTVAAVIAVYKLLTNPHQWDKTSHGITKVHN